jgi:hypothetical protein
VWLVRVFENRSIADHPQRSWYLLSSHTPTGKAGVLEKPVSIEVEEETKIHAPG